MTGGGVLFLFSLEFLISLVLLAYPDGVLSFSYLLYPIHGSVSGVVIILF